MAKRFTDTAKWKDTWFQGLPTKYKLCWLYILDECDHAGIWKPNIGLLQFQVGEPFEESELRRVFCERVEILQSGYWFIRKFIDFQYGELNPASRPHTAVLGILKKNGIGYTKGIDTLKDKDKEQDQDKDKDIETLEDFRACIDDLYMEQLKMAHKGKDVDLAINQAFLYMTTKNDKLDAAGVKRLLNTWLSNMKAEKVKTKNYGLH